MTSKMEMNRILNEIADRQYYAQVRGEPSQPFVDEKWAYANRFDKNSEEFKFCAKWISNQ